jgi:hypothetical protein
MKIKTIVCAALLAVSMTLTAADKPAAKEKAPHDGRLMDGATIRVEFLLTADRTAEAYLYDQKLKPVVPADQSVSLIVQGKDGAKTKIELGKGTEAFRSAGPVTIPEGAKAILTVKAGGKPENFRFDLDINPCKDCKKPNYACDCADCSH